MDTPTDQSRGAEAHTSQLVHAFESSASAVAEAVAPTLAVVKPKLRGWLHALTFPMALLAGVVLVAMSPTPGIRMANAIFAVTAAMMFGISATLHRGNWSPKHEAIIRRFDHATIFLIIAGTYTPFTFILLEGTSQKVLLALVWTGALAGVAFRVFWLGAPRWLYVPVYVALGWAAAFWMPDFWSSGGPVVFSLILLGGLMYSIGGLVYGLKRPNPSPTWFGFHEIFHALTVLAFGAHMVGAYVASANTVVTG